MASLRKVKEVEDESKKVVEKTTKKETSNNTLNKDGFVKGATLTAEQYAQYKTKQK